MNRRDALKQTALIMGYAVSGSVLTGVLQGCEADASDNWMPAALSETEVDIVAEFAEILVPATDTVGAKDALVHRFIDGMLAGYMPQKQVDNFKEGLTSVNAKSQSLHQKDFMAASQEERVAVVQSLADTVKEDMKSMAPKSPFFAQMKQLTLLGYFTSEPVGTNILAYDPIPGRYDPCISVEETGNKAWMY